MTGKEFDRIQSLFKQTERNIEVTSGNTSVRLVEDGEYVYGFEVFSNKLETTCEFDWEDPDPLTDKSVTDTKTLARILDETKLLETCDNVLTFTDELTSLSNAVNKLSNEEWLNGWKIYDYEDFGKELLRRKLNGVANAERIIEELDGNVDWQRYAEHNYDDVTFYEIPIARDENGVFVHW